MLFHGPSSSLPILEGITLDEIAILQHDGYPLINTWLLRNICMISLSGVLTKSLKCKKCLNSIEFHKCARFTADMFYSPFFFFFFFFVSLFHARVC